MAYAIADLKLTEPLPELVLRLAWAGYPLVYEPCLLVFHRHRPDHVEPATPVLVVG